MTTTSLSDHRIHVVAPNARAAVLGFALTLAVGLGLLVAASLAVALTTGAAVMPRVSVAGVGIGGLDRQAAMQRLRAVLPSLISGSLSVTLDGQSAEVPYARIGRGYEFDAMLDAALAVGRDDDPLQAGIARLRALLHDTSLPAQVHASDPQAMDQVVGELAGRFSSLATSATVRLAAGRYVVVPGNEGTRLDLPALRVQIEQIVATPDPADATLQLTTLPIIPGVTTDEAKAAVTRANAMISAPLELTAGVGTDAEHFTLSVGQLQGMIGFGARDGGQYTARVDAGSASAALAPLVKRVAVEPRDASFTFGASGISGVKAAVVGRQLDIDASVLAIRSALDTRAGGASAPRATLAFSVTAPALTTELATAAAPKMKRISTWTTHYVPAISNYWGKNISIPARDLDGYVLAPGDWFSFWNGIGPVTTARGYGQGGVIINGRSYPTGALAGGICSTSTTLFNAAMRAGLQIGERTNHSYYISRYPVGLDATVLKTDTSVTDMTFRNDTESPIVIRSYTGRGFVRFDLWGVSDGRTVSLSKPITSNHVAAHDTVVVNAKMKAGTTKRVESPHDGFHAVVTRTVRDAGGSLLHRNVWESFYRVVNGVTEVGPTPTPPPPAPSPPPTPGPTPQVPPPPA